MFKKEKGLKNPINKENQQRETENKNPKENCRKPTQKTERKDIGKKGKGKQKGKPKKPNKETPKSAICFFENQHIITQIKREKNRR